MSQPDEIRMVLDFSKALRARVSAITDPLGSEVAIWKWVRDPANESDVREIAAKFLVTSMRQQKRAVTRELEERTRDEAARNKVLADMMTPETKDEYERRLRWDRELEEREAAKAQELRAIRAELLKNLRRTRPEVKTKDVLSVHLQLLALDFPAENLLFGDMRQDRKRSFLPDLDWANTWGHKAKRAHAMENARREDDREFGFFAQAFVVMEDWKNSLRAKWTSELLPQTFRLDGVNVAWGEATIDQHQRRAESLRAHAVGTMETAALHLAAIEDIQAHNAANLYDLAAQEVAA
jgi:hypothetical protein